MFEINNYIMYKRDVCKIIDIKEMFYNNKDYLVLVPLNDESLKIDVPVDSIFLKRLISKDEIDALIKIIPDIPVILSDNKFIENEYKTLINSGSYEDLIKIIKTTYLRNKERIDNHKKAGDKDNYYFTRAENYLYNEFSVVLGMSFLETKDYIISKVKEIECNS